MSYAETHRGDHHETLSAPCPFCATLHGERGACPVDAYEDRACQCGNPDCGAC